MDGESRPQSASVKQKIFEQKNISGKKTFYGTHTAWFGNEADRYDQQYPIYLDIDLYNPTESTIYVDVENIVFANNADSNGDGMENDENAYRHLQEYYTGGISGRITIPPYEHRLLLDTLGYSFYNPIRERECEIPKVNVWGLSLYVYLIGAFRCGNKPPVLLGEDKKL